MINIYEVNETNAMIDKENLDVRTITMGISLLDCADENLEKVKENIYNKITTKARNLVSTDLDGHSESGQGWNRQRLYENRRTLLKCYDVNY